MECTFGNFGENSSHRVRSVFMFKSSVIQNVHSIRCEFSAKKEVNEINLEDTIDEIECEIKRADPLYEYIITFPTLEVGL